MNIAFDLDNTLVDYSGFMIRKQKEFEERTGVKYNIDLYYQEIARFKSDNDFAKFWDMYTLEYIQQPLIPQMVECMQDLLNKGHKVYIISARLPFGWFSDNPNFDIDKATKEQLAKQGIKYTDAICTLGKPKTDYILKWNIDLMIEDQGFDVQMCNGCKLLLLDKPYNRKDKCDFRIDSARDIEYFIK